LQDPLPPPRDEVDHAIRQAAALIRKSSYAVVLSGAGISAESGIPIYRGATGIWTRQGEPTIDGWELFNADPGRWWRITIDHGDSELSHAIASATPNAAHIGLADLEQLGLLQHVITQNIDNLHQRAGTKHITEIHGNRMKVRCMNCGGRDRIETISFERIPPLCPECGGILKTDVVMFGEPIPEDALHECYRVVARADLFLVIGTSAVVYPAAEFPIIAKRHGAPLIEINPFETNLSEVADVIVRAKAGEAVPAIVDILRR
jgi:NAD-dependent deacetylase